MIIDIGNFKQSGEYRLIVRKARTNKIVRKTDWVKNLITNRGVDSAMAQNAYNGSSISLVVGTGSATPTPADLLLQSYLAGSNITPTNVYSKNFTDEPYYIERLLKVTFPQGAVVGNVSEMGWALAATPTPTTQLYNRSLIVNAAGDPVTVTVLSDEYLTVEWRFRLIIPKLIQGQVPANIKGVQTLENYELSPIAVNNVSGNLYTPGWGFTSYAGSVQNLYPSISPSDGYEKSRLYTNVASRPDIAAPKPVGSGTVTTLNNADLLTVATYTTGSKRRDATFKWALTRGNVADINCFMLDFSIGVFCLYFPTFKFSKTANDQLELTIRWGLDN